MNIYLGFYVQKLQYTEQKAVQLVEEARLSYQNPVLLLKRIQCISVQV